MQKRIYRVVILIITFFLSLAFFVANIKENSITREIETTDMSDSSFPVLSVLKGENEFNFMYGYVKDTFTLGMREDITPVASDGSLTFQIYENGNEISAIEYEINDRLEQIVIETGECKLNSKEEGKSEAELKLSYSLFPETEYGLKLILINNDGKKLYYYTTLKYLKEHYFKENMKFIQMFEEAIFQKDQDYVKQFLETNGSMDNMDFHHVNLYSSHDLVTWKKLKIKKVVEPKITVLEHNTGTTAVRFHHVLEVGEENKNYYYVTEYYRVNHTERRTYLLAYDRRTEEVYNPEKTSLSKKQLKFGIGDKRVDVAVSEGESFIGFIRERELWLYDVKNNIMNKIFAFRKNAFLDEREFLDRHKVKILRVEENGDLFFSVYGYMNRGVYEGRTGVVIYKYIEQDKRLEEQVYIPIDKIYQELIADFDVFNYLSRDEFYYFTLDGVLYSYSLTTKKVQIIAQNVEGDHFFSIQNGSFIVWKEREKGGGAIRILNLENRKSVEKKPEVGKRLVLFGTIDDNIIYGSAQKSDVIKNKDGSEIVANEAIMIMDFFGKELKKYSRKNIYVTSVKIENKVIHLRRRKKENKEFLPYSDEQVLNNFAKKAEEVSVVDRRTEKYLTEYYLKLPKHAELKEAPTIFDEVKNTVILSETTTRLPEAEEKAYKFYANIYGRIEHTSNRLSDLISETNKGMGYVIDSKGNAVWERGNTKPVAKAEEVDVDYADPEDTPKEAAIRLFLTSKGIYISDSELKGNSSSIIDILQLQSEIRALDLTGVRLEEALYYVSMGHPIIAMADTKLVLIIGSNVKNITIMDVKTLKTEVLPKEEAIKLFEKSGNMFISVIG